MSMRLALGPLLLGLLAIIVVALIVLRQRSPAVRRGGSLVEAFRLVVSAPAYFVPAAMTFCGVGLVLLATGGGTNPFLDAGTGSSLGANLTILVLIAAGLAGHVGLLEARRDGRQPGPDAFLRGMRTHTPTFVVAKLALAAICSLLARNLSVQGASHDPSQWLAFVVPSILLGPAIGAATLRPGRPFSACLASLGILMRNPLRVTLIVASQLALCVTSIATLADMLWRTDVDRLTEIAIVNSSSLDFSLFPSIWYANTGCGFLVTAIAATASSVFVTAHWSAANGALLAQKGATTTGSRGTESHENRSRSSAGEQAPPGTSNPDAAAR